MSYRTERLAKDAIIVTALTKAEEEELDNKKPITINRGDLSFYVTPEQVEVYGIVDFATDSSDMKTVSTFGWLSNRIYAGMPIPAKYDHENHCAYSDLKVARWSETWNPAEALRYCHGLIGKPERIIVFKYIFKK